MTVALPGPGLARRFVRTFLFVATTVLTMTTAQSTPHRRFAPSTAVAAPGARPSPARTVRPAPAHARLADAFRHDVRAFAADLRRASQRGFGAPLAPERARRLAWVAVSEVYRYRVPPALIFGVMLQENPWFDPDRTSYMGAVGLMQVMPNVWGTICGPRFGRDLTDDRINLQCGIYVLAYYATLSDGAWKETLWRYNGWGDEYPGRVRQHVERRAHHLCPSGRFERCVTRPLYLAFRGGADLDPVRRGGSEER